MPSMNATTVLMYHAVPSDDGAAQGADAHYSVSRSRFRDQLALLRKAGRTASSVERIRRGEAAAGAVGITFDDGHESNAWAADALAEAGASADFFVNPSTVGQPRHLSWQALRDMAAAGMSIQSHGQTHRYLDELDDDAVRQELELSKATIEDRLGRRVDLFAPPGGRMGRGFARQAAQAGYRLVCSSRAGVWRRAANATEVPRLAVLGSTGSPQWMRWVEQDRGELLRCEWRYRLLAGTKRLLGNTRYERLRQRALGAGA